MAETHDALTEADIINLGKRIGAEILALPDDFNGESEQGEQTIDNIVLSTEMEIASKTYTQSMVPEDVDDSI